MTSQSNCLDYSEAENRHKRYRRLNPESARASYKRWVAKNREYTRESCRKYYEQNRDAILARRKLAGVNERAAARMRELRKDPSFKVLSLLRTRTWHAIKNSTGARKCARTIELVGCSIEELRWHLERQSQAGMTWENYGQWHIDHIKPCAKFDFTNPEHQRLCFHYTNLQPLWARDNHIKSDKEIS